MITKNHINSKAKYVGTLALSALLLHSCTDVLDEQPRTGYDPTFFKTENGINGGLTALYSHLRDLYGNGYYFNATETGTDEYTYGGQNYENFHVLDFSEGMVLSSTNCDAGRLWGTAFKYINTASGVIENASAAGIDKSLIAEARFFRAFDYFQLVQTFGGVPLDLGAGELAFNSSPSRESVRNTVPEVYTKAIFPDLIIASQDLPSKGRIVGGVSNVLAKLVLAKAYLTYGWWLENPNNIPTYPECNRTDPDGKNAQWYYQQAYDVAMDAINNPGAYGLQETYYDVNVASNDRNNEVLLFADHTQNSEQYNGASLTWGNGNEPENYTSWFVAWNYPADLTALGYNADKNEEVSFNPVQRDCVQALGRPWMRMAPINEVFTKTFSDKVNDSRYDGTFTYVFRGNWQKDAGSKSIEYVIGANGTKVYPGADNATIDPEKNFGMGDAILTFLDEDDPNVSYENMNSVGGGTLAGRGDYVINPSQIGRKAHPLLWKIGPYRTDNGSGFGEKNAASTRPYSIVKFSELYLIAAEAAVKGATGAVSARDLVNVLRARAGKWRWDNNGGCEKIEDRSAEMIAATPDVITIDYILDERSRELFGEGIRWFDLVRTQTWEARCSKYTSCGNSFTNHEPEVITRDIKAEYYLRPIPQGQLDALQMSEEAKKAYQNPAYRN